MRLLRTRLPAILALSLLVGSLSGCKVSHDDIDYWRRTVKGPGKIVRVLGSDRYALDLRIHAARALVEMERRDVDGVPELERALQALARPEAETTKAIADGLAAPLVTMMGNLEPAAPVDEVSGPPPSEIRAKDAAYVLLRDGYAQGETRARLTDAVVRWYAVDFTGRSLAGAYSVEQVVRQLGAPAAAILVDALSARMPQQALIKIAELIGGLGDDATKRAAAEKLVAIEVEMEGPEFVRWLGEQIQASYTAQEREVSPERVQAVASLNRENFINDGALPAMKHLNTQPPVTARLLAIAQTPPPPDTPAPLVERITLRRQRALMALEGAVGSAQLGPLLDLALDGQSPVPVRDYAFDRVGDIGSAEAVQRLWPVFQSPSREELDRRLRWRAGELVLILGGPEVVPAFLARMPASPGVTYEPEELDGYATRLDEMTDPPTELVRRQLHSPQWWKRVLAARFLERRGTAEDLVELEAMARDAAPVEGDGWSRREPPLATVGQVATAAAAGLRGRLSQPSQEAPATAE